jgi:hypothetical protein
MVTDHVIQLPRQNNNAKPAGLNARKSVYSQLLLVQCDLDSFLSGMLVMVGAAHFRYVQVATQRHRG